LVRVHQPYLLGALALVLVGLGCLLFGGIVFRRACILQDDITIFAVPVEHHHIFVLTNFECAVVGGILLDLSHAADVLEHPCIVHQGSWLVDHDKLCASGVDVNEQRGNTIPLIMQVPPLAVLVVVIDGLLEESCSNLLLIHLSVGLASLPADNSIEVNRLWIEWRR